MLSFTFCSWPDKVWMTNHWLRIVCLKFKEIKQPEEDLVDDNGKAAEDHNGNEDHNGRAFEFFPAWPGALAQFLTRLLNIRGEAHQMAGTPKPGENAEDNGGPNNDPDCVVHNYLQLSDSPETPTSPAFRFATTP